MKLRIKSVSRWFENIIITKLKINYYSKTLINPTSNNKIQQQKIQQPKFKKKKDNKKKRCAILLYFAS